jgi:hypothetical protein
LEWGEAEGEIDIVNIPGTLFRYYSVMIRLPNSQGEHPCVTNDHASARLSSSSSQQLSVNGKRKPNIGIDENSSREYKRIRRMGADKLEPLTGIPYKTLMIITLGVR